MTDNDLHHIQETPPDEVSQVLALQTGNARLQAQSERLRQRLEDTEADRDRRWRFTYILLTAGGLWLAGVFAVVIMQGLSGGALPDEPSWFHLPTAVLVALVGGPGASFLAGVLYVIRSMIPSQPDRRVG